MTTRWIKYSIFALLGAAAVILLTKKSDTVKKGCSDVVDYAYGVKRKLFRKAEETLDDLEDFTDDARKEIKKRQKEASASQL